MTEDNTEIYGFDITKDMGKYIDRCNDKFMMCVGGEIRINGHAAEMTEETTLITSKEQRDRARNWDAIGGVAGHGSIGKSDRAGADSRCV